MSTEQNVSAVGIYKCPPNMSNEEFVQKVTAVMDAALKHPAAKQHLVKYDLMVPNGKLDDHLERFGMPSPKGTVVVLVEWASHETMDEVMRIPELHEIVDTAKEEFGFHVDSCTYSVDVIKKGHN
ncbi:hypothetical protein B0H11DRAFT_2275506 [Mycena galericulata]|nr:hypothetical protein B0H11DRAFT_2275506 [Mycena galericulata]